jgi:threonyl-tRNA synthetase
VGRKIRDAEVKKIPFMLVVGEQEMLEEAVSVRKHGGEEVGKLKLEDFVSFFKEQVKINN